MPFDKVVVITGTSQGLGRALFDCLCSRPVQLVCVSRRFPDYQRNIAKKNSKIRLVKADLNHPESLPFRLAPIAPLLKKKTAEFIFISNAGRVGPIGSVGKLSSAAICESIRINLTAPMVLSNYFLSLFKNKPVRITVINVSSGAAKHPIAGWPVYCASKAGCAMFFDVLKKQFGGGNKIFDYDPGVMDTFMQKSIRNADKKQFPGLDYFIALKKDGKLKKPSDVAVEIVEKMLRL